MRVFVKVCCGGAARHETYVIPCKEPTASVASLKSLALDRCPETGGELSCGRDPDHFQLTLSGNGAALSDKDTIQDVLRDGEFVCLCTWCCTLQFTLFQARYNNYYFAAGSKDAPSTESSCNAQLPTYGAYPVLLYMHVDSYCQKVAESAANCVCVFSLAFDSDLCRALSSIEEKKVCALTMKSVHVASYNGS